MEKSHKKRVLIVDDHPMMRKGLANTIESEPGYEVAFKLEKAEQVLEILENNELDLLLVDISLPGMNGIELVKNVVFRKPEQKIIVISRHEENLYAERALRAGANGYIMKFESAEVILKAVRKVLNGGVYISDAVSDRMLKNSMFGNKNPLKTPMETLSDRELEVFELMGRGKSTSEIAEQLHLTKKTIETYRSRTKEKMGFKNSTEMLIHAVKWLSIESPGEVKK
ncbi:response regulator transcription factor [Rhodohalobacter sp. 8-1]|uniref:response regulator transcription factor n=1 Tax=Rhodohalobacter sp. 8-1 TaxID=3131972 RepID=UPI0030ECC32D